MNITIRRISPTFIEVATSVNEPFVIRCQEKSVHLHSSTKEDTSEHVKDERLRKAVLLKIRSFLEDETKKE